MKAPRYVLLTNARLFDVNKKSLIENASVLIDGSAGTILQAGKAGEVEGGHEAEVIDCKGNVVLPGLIDAHLHLSGTRTGDFLKETLLTPYETLVARVVQDLRALINAGFTTVVDAGGLIALGIKQAVEEGTIEGPRIVAAGAPLSQTFGHGDAHYFPIEMVDVRTSKFSRPLGSLICDGVDECRKAARYALRMGSDFIKIFTTGGVLSWKDRPEYTQFTLEEIRAIVEEAAAAGRFVHAHAEGARGIVNALLGGVKVIAHADMIDERGVELALEKNAVVVPTLSVSDHIIRYGREVGIPEWGIEKETELSKYHAENARRAYKAGVKLATGTDFAGGTKAFRHGDNALEISLFVKWLQMPPEDALVAATKHAAEAAGLEKQTGAVEPGKWADLVVVRGNPLMDVDLLLDSNNVLLVMKKGKILKNLL